MNILLGTTIPPPAVIMPEVEHDPPTKCETGQYVPDPYNCNAYYRCVLGEMKKQYCAGGLHWNKQTSNCDWPAVAKCKEQRRKNDHSSAYSLVRTFYFNTAGNKPSSNLSTTKFTTQTWSTTHSKATSQFTAQTTTQWTTTTTTRAPPSQETLEHCNSGDYYPHEHCNSFYVCVNGQLVTQSCGPGLHWNADKGICDWSYKVKCLNKKQVAQQTEKLIKESGSK